MIKYGVAAAVAALLATPAMAGGVAVCMGSTEDRQGMTDFSAYTIARSELSTVDRGALQDEAERNFRSSYRENQRVRCRGYEGTGHYVVVRAAQALNGRVLQLLGFGFGDNRDEALANSRQQLDEYPGYHMFIGRGGELEVIEEGSVDS
ncbi:MAG: hypothetical protein HKN78_12820 [Sphingomonadaceae bacterium]|nr:hypothetical protein [Sphingomonadaceae bacterium]